MLKYIKFLYQITTSSKFVKRGKCNKCGNCCRNIILTEDEKPIKNPEQFERLKKLDKHLNNFYVSGKDENGSLLFTCNEIDENNRCKVYFFRGLGCRMYPKKDTKFLINGGKPLDGCGFYYEPDKSFKSYIKDSKEKP
jgi:hypothetical protein